MADLVSWISGAAGFGSLVVAGMAYRFSSRTRQQTERQTENLNRRDLFLSLHERLCSPDQIRGRRFIREQIKDPGDADRQVVSTDTSAYVAVGSLAMLDTLGLYVENGYVDSKLVLQEWGYVLAELHPHAKHFTAVRVWNGRQPWPHYTRLAEQAEEWVRQGGQ